MLEVDVVGLAKISEPWREAWLYDRIEYECDGEYEYEEIGPITELAETFRPRRPHSRRTNIRRFRLTLFP
jgi:hypothetical protein